MIKEYNELNQTIKKTRKKNNRDFEFNLAKSSRESPKQVYSYITGSSKTTTKESIKTLNLSEENQKDTQCVKQTTTHGVKQAN
jgi:hypothetical protein